MYIKHDLGDLGVALSKAMVLKLWVVIPLRFTYLISSIHNIAELQYNSLINGHHNLRDCINGLKH